MFIYRYVYLFCGQCTWQCIAVTVSQSRTLSRIPVTVLCTSSCYNDKRHTCVVMCVLVQAGFRYGQNVYLMRNFWMYTLINVSIHFDMKYLVWQFILYNVLNMY